MSDFDINWIRTPESEESGSADVLDLLWKRPTWMADAACRGMPVNLFYPQRGDSTYEAKQVCGRCPVREDCYRFAMDTNQTIGIWGRTSERQRRDRRPAWNAARRRGSAA